VSFNQELYDYKSTINSIIGKVNNTATSGFRPYLVSFNQELYDYDYKSTINSIIGKARVRIECLTLICELKNLGPHRYLPHPSLRGLIFENDQSLHCLGFNEKGYCSKD
jgi:hypothetical protein